MAKKKSETSETPKAEKAAPKKAAATKKAGDSKAVAPTGSPLVDTKLAAGNAARMLVAGLKKPEASSQGTKPQSKLFQQIKMGQSHSSAMGGVLNKSGDTSKKPNAPLHGGNVKKHNQTFGSDASKSFVPRRTAG